ncbi:hypothetical protein MMC22_002018 [Lobaria immixta]|nr:hypothetical protein [Lobaria immixta]
MSAGQGSSSIPQPVMDALDDIEKVIEGVDDIDLDNTSRRKMFHQIASGCVAVRIYFESLKKNEEASPLSIVERDNLSSVTDVLDALVFIQAADLNDNVIIRLLELSQEAVRKIAEIDMY